MTSAADAVQAASAVLAAVAESDLMLSTDAQIMALVEIFPRTLETIEMEGRLVGLKEAIRGSA